MRVLSITMTTPAMSLLREPQQSGYNACAMLVRELGEFELIDALASAIADRNQQCIKSLDERGFQMLRAIGDDAAAWSSPSGVRVFTADTMVEGVHFDLRYTGWRDLGWKALATNISDVAAMGCAPTYATVTLGLRGDLPVDGLVEMYKGMMDLTETCGGAVVGGDIVKSPVFFISIALEGAALRGTPEQLMLRDRAKPGDLIAVTGTLGSSGGGLKLLAEGAGVTELNAAAFLKNAHNRPVPRVSEGETLAELGVRCAMDISDGLRDDLGKLCRASNVGAQVRSPLIPVDHRLKAVFPDEWLALAIGGGEDYELLFTAHAEVISRAATTISTPITVIGRIHEAGQGITVLDESGNVLEVGAGGWDHFRSD